MRKFLLYSSALAVLGLSGVAEAACIQTPTCSSLGYDSSTSCEGGLKCPFGEAWNCTLNEKITELEKIIEEIKIGCSQSNCSIGDILYSDMSCSPNAVAGETAIGVVFDRVNRKALALDVASPVWSEKTFDVPGIPNVTSEEEAVKDMNGKDYTKAAQEFCNENGYSCPAFDYIAKYVTEGTNAGDWYLPSLGELKIMYDNEALINEAMRKVGGFILSSTNALSSSEYSSTMVWDIAYFTNRVTPLSISRGYKTNTSSQIRPVLAF